MLKRTVLFFVIVGIATAYIFFITTKHKNIEEHKATKPIENNTAQPAAEVKKVLVVPLGTKADEQSAQKIYRQFSSILPSARLELLRELPASAYYAPNHRYRADSLIAMMSRSACKDEICLGITTVDISASKHGKADWGVMGLGYCPGNACISSSYRLKDKTHFWKVAIHELGHTTGLPHCPVKTCFMRDAEKKNPTAEEKEFCADCKKKLTGLGWTL